MGASDTPNVLSSATQTRRAPSCEESRRVGSSAVQNCSGPGAAGSARSQPRRWRWPRRRSPGAVRAGIAVPGILMGSVQNACLSGDCWKPDVFDKILINVLGSAENKI